MNPLEVKTNELESYFMSWEKMCARPYDKDKTDPYTKTRVILMNGTEFESNWFLHQFARNCNDNELKREIALVRNQEQQQQKRISALKPINENMLETTISYEQLAIDLTAILAQNETDQNNKNALDFALLEDFDHLYRFANLLKMDFNIDAETLVGKFTEITPGRPTIDIFYQNSDILFLQNRVRQLLCQDMNHLLLTLLRETAFPFLYFCNTLAHCRKTLLHYLCFYNMLAPRQMK